MLEKIIKDVAKLTPDTNSKRCQHGPEDELNTVNIILIRRVGLTYSIVNICYGIEKTKNRKGARESGTDLLTFPTHESGYILWETRNVSTYSFSRMASETDLLPELHTKTNQNMVLRCLHSDGVSI